MTDPTTQAYAPLIVGIDRGTKDQTAMSIGHHNADGTYTVLSILHGADAEAVAALVAERDAAIQRAEAAERENEKLNDLVTYHHNAAIRAEAQAAAGFEAGRDAAAEAVRAEGRMSADGNDLDPGLMAALQAIETLTPPTDHAAALTARLDAEWDAAIEAAGNLESVHGYSNAVPRHRIRALRRRPA